MAWCRRPGAFALAAFVTAPVAWAAAPTDAQHAYDTGHFAEARLLWLKAAQTGDPAAQFALGLMYDLGKGVPADSAAAYGWYLAAARSGFVPAEVNVGVMNDSGFGVARNSAAAALWYARAAARGNATAAYNLGQLYQYGEGVPANQDIAFAWYTEAAHDLPAAAEKIASWPRRTAPIAAGAALTRPVTEPQAVIADAKGTTAELVWSAPPQPVPVSYYYTVVGLDSAGPHVVAADYLNRSATIVPLPAPSQFPAYAWRVYAVADKTRHYAPSAWQKFTLGDR